ncbi:MAG: ATP-binding cassette domain-containing protein [Anaerolineae bacterium]|nr:ATP-binding cassette domain-containing protein [Anaerolineae bacterium]
MLAIETHALTKDFNGLRAVDGLDLEVRQGEIFGFLGPNGAGKTTTIRMLMDIIKPDSGRIEILGQPLQPSTLDRIGYLPEERGLYRKIKTVDCLTYLAVLKGMERRTARERALALLERVDLAEFADKKVETLSRGMQQKAQFVATLVHDPELLILDEPFQGLDPLNTELLKEMVRELHGQGKTIIFSTHQMNQVEELCDRILLIDHGQTVLYGPLREIQARYAPHAVRFRGQALPTDLPGTQRLERQEEGFVAYLAEGVTPSLFLRQLVERGAEITHFEVVTPPLEEIFIEVVEKRRRR